MIRPRTGGFPQPGPLRPAPYPDGQGGQAAGAFPAGGDGRGGCPAKNNSDH